MQSFRDYRRGFAPGQHPLRPIAHFRPVGNWHRPLPAAGLRFSRLLLRYYALSFDTGQTGRPATPALTATMPTPLMTRLRIAAVRRVGLLLSARLFGLGKFLGCFKFTLLLGFLLAQSLILLDWSEASRKDFLPLSIGGDAGQPIREPAPGVRRDRGARVLARAAPIHRQSPSGGGAASGSSRSWLSHSRSVGHSRIRASCATSAVSH